MGDIYGRSQSPGRRLLVLAGAIVVFAGAGWADLVTVDQVTVRDDFEGGNLDGWGLPDYYGLARDGDNGMLRVGGSSREEQEAFHLAYKGVGPELGDCAVEARIHQFAGSWAGLFMRRAQGRHFEAFIAGARILVRRQPGSVVLSTAPLPATKADWRTLRIVGIGPSIRVYVDRQLVFACEDEELTSGGAGICCHYTYAYFDDFVLTGHLRPEETLLVRPQAPADGLVVAPGEPATVVLQVRNAGEAARDATVQWGLADGDGGPAGSHELHLQPGEQGEALLELPALSEGLHWIEASTKEREQVLQTRRFPVAAVVPPDVPADEPFLAIGAYDKYELGGEPWELNTVLHAMCSDMHAHGLNTIMAGNVMPKPDLTQMNILARYGMKVILRGIGEIPPEVAAHPSVLAIAFGDEPSMEEIEGYRKRFDELAAKYGKPVTTCLVGDSAASRRSNDPWLVWPELGSALKMARYYPIRKSIYDLVCYPSYKGYPPEAIFRLLEVAAGDDGWYYVMQTFGDRVSEQMPEPYWRNPTGAEVRGMAHLALAHGARGIICYTYQTERESWPALVDQRRLQPTDDKYAALAEVARKVHPAREALLSSHWESQEVRTEPLTIEAVGRRTAGAGAPGDGRLLVYLVNRDTDAPVDAAITIMNPVVENKRVPLAKVTSLFSGREVAITQGDDRCHASVHLEPGDGELWELTVATGG